MRKIVFGILFLFSLQIYGQQANEPEFSRKVFSSDFSAEDRALWTQVNNESYFLLIKDNAYIIECSNSGKKAFLLPKGSPKLDTFRLTAQLMPDRKKDDDGVAAIAFDIQENLKGGYLVQLNSQNQYRIVSIEGSGSYTPLTNKGKKNGWVGLKTPKEQLNISFDIKQVGRAVTVTIDGEEEFSFENPITTPGQAGVFISGIYKSRVMNYAVYAPELTNPKIGGKTYKDMSTLNNALLECKKESKDLADKNETLKQELAQARYKNKELQTYISNNLDVKLQDDLNKQKEKADKLEKENQQLKAEMEDLKLLKKSIEENKDGDLVMTLSENLKKEQEKNAALEKKLKALNKKTPKK